MLLIFIEIISFRTIFTIFFVTQDDHFPPFPNTSDAGIRFIDSTFGHVARSTSLFKILVLPTLQPNSSVLIF